MFKYQYIYYMQTVVVVWSLDNKHYIYDMRQSGLTYRTVDTVDSQNHETCAAVCILLIHLHRDSLQIHLLNFTLP